MTAEQERAIDWIAAIAEADDLHVVVNGDSLHVTTESGMGAVVTRRGEILPDSPMLGVVWRRGRVVDVVSTS